MRLALIALSAMLLIPSVQACSIAFEEFGSADLAGNKVLTNIGQDGVLIDLGTGKQTTLHQDFFPRHMFAGSTPYVLHAGQEGLGADCSGKKYFEVLKINGDQMHQSGAVIAFDSDGDYYAWATGSGVYIAKLGQWTATKITSGVNEEHYPAIALNHAANEIAVVRGDEIVVYDLAGKVIERHNDIGKSSYGQILDWHEGDLVVARRLDQSTAFTIISEAQRREFKIEHDGWQSPSVATGKHLIIHYGDDVLRLAPMGSQKLKIPAGYIPTAVGGDENGAVVMFTDDENFHATGILKISSTGAISSWYEKNPLGNWVPATKPSFAWTAGPTGTVISPQTPEGPAGEDVPFVGVPLLLGALAVALLRRRTA